MNNKKLNNIITIIVCVSICVGMIAINIFTKKESKKEESKPQENVQEQLVEEEQVEEDEVQGDQIPESDLSDNSLYDDNASDDYTEQGDTDITVFFKNGESLYNNDDIPLSYFDNLMLRIQKFCDLNYGDVVKEIEIDSDTVMVTDEEVVFQGNLKNGHYLTVSYDIQKKQFTMSDTIK